MAEGKRATLTTVDVNKHEKKATKEEKTFRFNLTLTESNVKSCPIFNYKDLMKNAKKTENDPFGDEEDDSDVLRLAKKFEAKYGGSNPKKKKSRQNDYYDIGAGYDESDSFIDNTDAYDEIVPDDTSPVHGGFYINSGLLEFTFEKNLNNNESDSPHVPSSSNSNKRQRVLSSSADDSNDENKNGTADKKVKLDSNITNGVKKSKENGEKPLNVLLPKKKSAVTSLKKKTSSDEFVTTTDKKYSKKKNEKEKKSNENSKKKTDREPSVISLNDDSSKDSISTNTKSSSSATSTNNSDSDNSSSELSDVDEIKDQDKNKNNKIKENKEKIIETANEINNETNDDVNNDVNNVNKISENNNVSLETNGTVEKLLPENLPNGLVPLIDNLEKKYFDANCLPDDNISDEIKELFLSLENVCQKLESTSKKKVYKYIADKLNVEEGVLMKQISKIVIDKENIKLEVYLKKLKAYIDSIMPDIIEKYNKAKQNELKMVNAGNPLGQTTKKRFIWSNESIEIMKHIINCKEVCYNYETHEITYQQYLQNFFVEKLIPQWPPKWMSLNAILQIFPNNKNNPSTYSKEIYKSSTSSYISKSNSSKSIPSERSKEIDNYKNKISNEKRSSDKHRIENDKKFDDKYKVDDNKHKMDDKYKTDNKNDDKYKVDENKYKMDVNKYKVDENKYKMDDKYNKVDENKYKVDDKYKADNNKHKIDINKYKVDNKYKMDINKYKVDDKYKTDDSKHNADDKYKVDGKFKVDGRSKDDRSKDDRYKSDVKYKSDDRHRTNDKYKVDDKYRTNDKYRNDDKSERKDHKNQLMDKKVEKSLDGVYKKSESYKRNEEIYHKSNVSDKRNDVDNVYNNKYRIKTVIEINEKATMKETKNNKCELDFKNLSSGLNEKKLKGGEKYDDYKKYVDKKESDSKTNKINETNKFDNRSNSDAFNEIGVKKIDFLSKNLNFLNYESKWKDTEISLKKISQSNDITIKTISGEDQRNKNVEVIEINDEDNNHEKTSNLFISEVMKNLKDLEQFTRDNGSKSPIAISSSKYLNK